MREELDDLGTADGSGKQAKVKVPPGHPGYRRQHLPVKVILQRRPLSPRRPGPTAMGWFAQSAFVDEDDGTHPTQAWRILRQLGWSCQRPVGRALERDT